MNLILLCAGEGTRFRPHTQYRPKPALPFLNIPLACYSLSWAQELKPWRLIVNTYHLPEQIHQLINAIPHGSTEVLFSNEWPRLMGSGGALAKAANFLSSSPEFLVMNGDEVFLPERSGFLSEALIRHRIEKRLSSLFVMEHPAVGTQFGGIWADATGRVLGFGKNPVPGSVKGWHFLGAALHSRRLLDRLSPEVTSNILYDDLQRAIVEGELVSIEPVQGWWHETGNEKDYLIATAACLQILKNSPPQAQLLKSALVQFGSDWTLETLPTGSLLFRPKDLIIPPEVHLKGWNVLGEKVHLGENVCLENCVLGNEISVSNVNLENQFLIQPL